MKIDDELKRQDELKENIKSLEEDLRKLVDFRGKMETSVEEFKSFEDTISQLVEESEHISTTKDFMDKCDALSESLKLQFTLKLKTPLSLPVLAQVEISEMEEEKVHEIGQIQEQLIKLSTASETDFLGLNNFLVNLEKAYERAHSEGIQWEQVLVKSRDFIVDQEVKFTRIIDSTRQLYLLLCKRNTREPNLKDVSVEGQLDFIKDEIEILRSVLEKATKFMATEEKSVQGERGSGEVRN